jgi:methyl-accepting chemotaxis protein
MVGDISDVSGTLNCSAHEISSGNNDLSERTQEQASCLVETSASLNNLTQTIKKNAANANEASDLAGTATNFAQKGGEAVNQAITTMGDINESAKKIQEITGVIDGIAFQTNLLALNASVEAARAGEQGRGFAVVASEVRNLAQRSAEAAKQIKGLINDSMNKVASGDAQVKVTWTTMQDIVTSIEHVNSIVAKISTASNEQSLSIEQINIVISQLEGNTQKNAAQVEEVAASAELLKEQSNKLVDIVGEFEIKQTNKVKAKPKQTTSRDSYSPAPQTTQSTPDLDSAWEEF